MTQFQKIKTLITKNSVFSFLCLFLIIGYLTIRLVNLTIIPVFADEAIYIRWAQVMRAVSSLRFLPLSDGKQPLFMWLIIPFLKFINDPLIAGRLVSVLAGLGTMIGVFFLSRLLFRKKEISLFAALLYLISPFTFFFDRLALADGLLSLFFVWTLTFLVLLVKNIRLDFAMIAGISLGLAMITKSPALFIVLLLPATIIIIGSGAMKQWSNVLKLFFFWGIVYLFGFAIYNILRLGPEFHMIAIRNKDYIFPLAEILKHPLSPLLENLKNAVSWFWIMLTPLPLAAGVAGIILSLKKNFKETFLLCLWLFVPLLGQSAIAKVYTSRYVLFVVPLFLIFAAVSMEKVFSLLKNKWLTILFLSAVFFFPIYQIFLLLAFPQKSWLPANERSGYLELWTAGYGIKEAADYLKDAAKKEKVLVGTEGYFGTLPDGLQIYLEKVPNITVIGVGYPVNELSPKLTSALADSRVFLLVNDSRFGIKNTNGLQLMGSYPKANQKNGGQENLLFFEVLR